MSAETKIPEDIKENLREKYGKKVSFKFGLVTCSDEFLDSSYGIYNRMEQLAKYHWEDFVILGETGTGKDLVAGGVHSLSERCNYPFKAINCAGIPTELFEAEMFGSKAGAYTDAKQDREGCLTLANNGTLFLDEIGNLSLHHQLKLLRVIETKKFSPLGIGKKTDSPLEREVDVRMILATNRDLEELVAEGKFSSPLKYRIYPPAIILPTLKERKEDIPLLADFFSMMYIHKYKKKCPDLEGLAITDDALELLAAQDWPGNVRELKRIIECCIVGRTSNTITKKMLEQLYWNTRNPKDFRIKVEFPINLKQYSIDTEKNLIMWALAKTKGNKTGAAGILGISQKSLWHRMRKLKLQTKAQEYSY